MVTEERRPIDVALDVFLYAPIGVSLEIWDRLPELAEVGRKRLTAQAPAAKMVGRFAVSAGLSKLEERLGDFAARGRQAGSTEEAEPAEAPDGVGTGKAATVEVAIGSYDELKAIEIVALLPTLTVDQRETVRTRELRGRARRTILTKLDRLDSTETDSGR